MNKQIIVFSPHPDDETLACGGTIVQSLQNGYSVYVVFMTDGSNSHLSRFRIKTEPSPRELKVIRYEEARAAAKILGVNSDNLIFLDFIDGRLSLNKRCAQRKVKKVLVEIKPDEVYCPSKEDGHSDHRATYTIVSTSCKAIRLQAVIYQYVISAPFWGKTQGKQFVIRDISDSLATKKQAINAYISQISNFSPKQNAPILSRDFLARFLNNSEVFMT